MQLTTQSRGRSNVCSELTESSAMIATAQLWRDEKAITGKPKHGKREFSSRRRSIVVICSLRDRFYGLFDFRDVKRLRSKSKMPVNVTLLLPVWQIL